MSLAATVGSPSHFEAKGELRTFSLVLCGILVLKKYRCTVLMYSKSIVLCFSKMISVFYLMLMPYYWSTRLSVVTVLCDVAGINVLHNFFFC